MSTSAVRTALEETDGKTGAFVRKPSVFRSTIEKGGEFEPEGERAHHHRLRP